MLVTTGLKRKLEADSHLNQIQLTINCHIYLGLSYIVVAIMLNARVLLLVYCPRVLLTGFCQYYSHYLIVVL